MAKSGKVLERKEPKKTYTAAQIAKYKQRIFHEHLQELNVAQTEWFEKGWLAGRIALQEELAILLGYKIAKESDGE